MSSYRAYRVCQSTTALSVVALTKRANMQFQKAIKNATAQVLGSTQIDISLTELFFNMPYLNR